MFSKFADIYKYRQMIFSLVHRDLRGRYKGSVLGFMWTFLNPLLQLCVYTFVFSIILRSDIEKYYLFLFVALVPWIFCSTSVSAGCGCILSSADMVRKIYFPREVLPISFVTTAFVNMLLSFVVVFGTLFLSGWGINIKALLFLPVYLIVQYLFVLGMTLLFSSLTVYFRDLQHILGIIVMAWQMLTPVMYASSRVPEKYLLLFNLNPMTPIINGYRTILYYKQIPQINYLFFSFAIGIFFLIFGWMIFAKLQKGFAEEL